MTKPKKPEVLAVARWPVGGIRTYLRELVRQDAFADVDFTIVMPRTSESEHLLAEISRQGIRWELVDNGTAPLWKKTAALCAERRFSLVHAHGFTSAIVSLVSARRYDIPLLLTAHDVFTHRQYTGAIGALKRQFVQATLRRVDVIHAVTHDGARNILEYLPRVSQGPCRIEVIPHGVNVEVFRAGDTRNIRAECKFGSDRAVFGFFGRFMAQKGFRVLVDAVSRLVDEGHASKFAVVCVGGGGFVREDTALIESRGLGSQFVFLPFERNIGPTLKGVDAVVMPSLWEASGLLAMEAMVSGAPLIATTCVGLRETIANTPTRRVVPGSAAELAEAMRNEMARSSRQESQRFVPEAAARFDARASFERLRALCDELLKKA